MFLALVPAVVIVAFLALGPHNASEPSYKGKNLSDWIATYVTGSPPVLAPQEQRDRANEAVRDIGTNGIPYLLNWYAYDKWPRRAKADTVYTNLPRTLRTNLSVVRFLYKDPNDLRSKCAVMALAALDPQALDSNSAYLRFTRTTNTFAEWYRAARLVDYIAALRDGFYTPTPVTNGSR
jgi:hypothetical protein